MAFPFWKKAPTKNHQKHRNTGILGDFLLSRSDRCRGCQQAQPPSQDTNDSGRHEDSTDSTGSGKNAELFIGMNSGST